MKLWELFTGKLESTRSFRHLLHLSFIHKWFEHLSHPSFQSLLLPRAWWTSVPLWIIDPKCGFSIPWPPDFQTFSSAFPQPLTMVIAWVLSSLKTAHLQNLLIQSFYSLAAAFSPWWFRFYHHNCFLSSSEPLHYSFLAVLSCLHFPHHSTLTPGSIFLNKLFLIFSMSSPPCPLVTFMGRNNSAFCVHTRMPRESWENLYNLADHFNLCSPHSTGLSIIWKLPYFSRIVCFPHICKHHFKSFFLSSNVLEFSPFYSFFSEKIETIWWK